MARFRRLGEFEYSGKLEPCPFCGSKAVMYYGECEEYVKFWRMRRDPDYVAQFNDAIVRCSDIHCLGRIGRYYDGPDAAAEAWNQRVTGGLT